MEHVAQSILAQGEDLFLRISISLDGIGVDHDEIRGVPGNWEKACETYKLLDALRRQYPNFNIDCSTCFNYYNQHKIQKIFTYLREHFQFNNHSLGFIRDGGPDPLCKDIDIELYIHSIQWVKEQKKQQDNRPLARAFRAVTDLNGEILTQTLKVDRMILPCTAGKKMLVLYDTGDVYPCEVLPDKKLGNIREWHLDIRKLLGTPQAQEIIRWITDSKCYCTWECGINANLFLDKRNYPMLAGKMVRNVWG